MRQGLGADLDDYSLGALNLAFRDEESRVALESGLNRLVECKSAHAARRRRGFSARARWLRESECQHSEENSESKFLH
jgi:hypothetical protein